MSYFNFFVPAGFCLCTASGIYTRRHGRRFIYLSHHLIQEPRYEFFFSSCSLILLFDQSTVRLNRSCAVLYLFAHFDFQTTCKTYLYFTSESFDNSFSHLFGHKEVNERNLYIFGPHVYKIPCTRWRALMKYNLQLIQVYILNLNFICIGDREHAALIGPSYRTPDENIELVSGKLQVHL